MRNLAFSLLPFLSLLTWFLDCWLTPTPRIQGREERGRNERIESCWCCDLLTRVNNNTKSNSRILWGHGNYLGQLRYPRVHILFPSPNPFPTSQNKKWEWERDWVHERTDAERAEFLATFPFMTALSSSWSLCSLQLIDD